MRHAIKVTFDIFVISLLLYGKCNNLLVFSNIKEFSVRILKNLQNHGLVVKRCVTNMPDTHFCSIFVSVCLRRKGINISPHPRFSKTIDPTGVWSMCEAKKSFVTSPKLLSFFLKYMFFDSLFQIQKQPPKVFFEKRCS